MDDTVLTLVLYRIGWMTAT